MPSWGRSRSERVGDLFRGNAPVGGRLSTSGDSGLSLEVEGAPNRDLALAFQGRLQETLDAEVRAIERAYWAAMNRVVEAGKGRLRADIVAGGFHKGEALSKTWRGHTYPRSKDSLDVAGFIHTKAGIIISAFESGVTITVSGGHKYLAIPLAPAKAIIRRLRRAKMRGPRQGGAGRDSFGRFTRDDSYVDQVASALGTDLVPIISADRQSGILVAANDLTLTRTGLVARNQRRAATPIFALSRQATLRRRIKGRALLDEIQRNFPGDFTNALAGELAEMGRR